MPTRAALLAACLPLLAACSFGGGEETRTFDETGFERVTAAAGVNVQLRQGPFAITATGAEAALNSLRIEKDGSELKVSRRSGLFIGWGQDAHVVVTAPAYTEISAAAGADIEGDNLALEAVSVRAVAGSDVDLSGTCASIDAASNTGSDLDAGELVCATAKVSANTGGDATVHATQSVEASASTGSDVTVHGAPSQVSEDASTGGDIRIR